MHGEPHDGLTWFVDRALGKRMVRALRDDGCSVEWHGDHFEDTAEDPVWISYAAARGWVILTKDKAVLIVRGKKPGGIPNRDRHKTKVASLSAFAP